MVIQICKQILWDRKDDEGYGGVEVQSLSLLS